MGGINNYIDPITFNAAYYMYQNTNNKWDQIREKDVVVSAGSSMWNGGTTLTPSFYSFAKQQYFKNPILDKKPNIVIFGHTHVAEFKKYDDKHVYVNSGTWIDNVPKCTYVEIEPGEKNTYNVRLVDYKDDNKLLNEATVQLASK